MTSYRMLFITLSLSCASRRCSEEASKRSLRKHFPHLKKLPGMGKREEKRHREVIASETISHHITLHYITLHYIILYYIILYNIILY